MVICLGPSPSSPFQLRDFPQFEFAFSAVTAEPFSLDTFVSSDLRPSRFHLNHLVQVICDRTVFN
jgi:hypothetical protein